jgi:soluble lytic murein transglycosylase-like protein
MRVRARVMVGLLGLCGTVHAAERVTLRNGFELDCMRQEPTGDRVRLYLVPSGTASGSATPENYIEVSAAEIVRSEPLELTAPVALVKNPVSTQTAVAGEPTAAEMQQMLAAAGEKQHVDADLLASVVRAESGWHTHAVSRAGAQGLMQLMPGTAAQLGVTDSFAAEQNIGGGALYMDQLLTRYHDNIAFALAAYNAGPAAVDRYHGVPPFAETRAYVSRVIREFNRRKLAGASPANGSMAAK